MDMVLALIRVTSRSVTLKFCCFLFFSLQIHIVNAESLDEFFDRHGVPMLWIEPESGQIVDANPAAQNFYQFSREQLQKMRISDINLLSAEQIRQERDQAAAEGRNYFIFRHRLADGDERTVEVFSHPYQRGDRQLLLSVIKDITPIRDLSLGMWHYQDLLEEMVEQQTDALRKRSREILFLLIVGLSTTSAIIFALIVVMRKRRNAEHDAKRFKSMADNALFGHVVNDLKGNIIYVNEYFATVHSF